MSPSRIPLLPTKILAWDTAARAREQKKLEIEVKVAMNKVGEMFEVEEAEVSDYYHIWTYML